MMAGMDASHIRHVCADRGCTRCHQSYCDVCHGVDDRMPAVCPGRPLTWQELYLLSQGFLDFVRLADGKRYGIALLGRPPTRAIGVYPVRRRIGAKVYRAADPWRNWPSLALDLPGIDKPIKLEAYQDRVAVLVERRTIAADDDNRMIIEFGDIAYDGRTFTARRQRRLPAPSGTKTVRYTETGAPWILPYDGDGFPAAAAMARHRASAL